MISAVKKEAGHIPDAFLCAHFGLSRSWLYKKRQCLAPESLVHKKQICQHIGELFSASDETYGSPRIYKELKKMGLKVSENTVAKYMAEMGLDARYKKKFKPRTTDSDHNSPVAERLFKIEDHLTLPTAPERLLAGDITYLRLGGQFLYLAVVLDVFTREVVGWSIKKTLHTQLVLDALAAAMQKVGPDAEVIFHSDRGSQYASEAYRKFCNAKGILPSMSRKATCYDNAYVESWFASLKKERIFRKNYRTENELRADVFDYIEVWYNRKRAHSSLGYMSPMEFRESQKLAR